LTAESVGAGTTLACRATRRLVEPEAFVTLPVRFVLVAAASETRTQMLLEIEPLLVSKIELEKTALVLVATWKPDEADTVTVPKFDPLSV
jgi:hypothetical protein